GRFRAAVREEGASEAARLRDALCERPLVLVVKEVGSMDQARGLFLNRRDDTRVILPQRIHADAGNEIEITLAIDVPHVGAIAAMEHKRVARVILQQILLFELDDISG